MTTSALLLLTLFSQPPEPKPEPLKVTGVTVLTVLEFPVTVHAPKADLVYWRYKVAGVEASTPSGHQGPAQLVVTKLPPNSDTIIQADCWVIDWEAKTKVLQTRTVVLRRGTGEKKEDPEVDEDDAPKPKPGFSRILIVEETMDRTAEQAKVLNRIQSTEQPVPVRVIDKDQGLAAFKSGVDFAKGVGLPAVVFSDDKWGPREAVQLPKDYAGWEKLLKDRGK